MNKSTLAIVVSIIASASVHAAEVYNKNGNKLDVYGKVKAMHYMSDYDSKDGDQSYVLMNPLMILVKIIKLRWIHILSYDQMV
ncbi:porin, partial [Salmonella enterica]|uniref:porin n=2 Tax=Salmonella enterica TaxID=28901 RepID=UPI001EFBC7E1